jgi:hypothetical protein
MADRSSSMGPTAPRPIDLLRMLGQLRRGSASDAPLGLFSAIKELVRTPGGAPDSSLSAKDVDRSEEFRDLATPELRRGDEAFDFQLARLEVVDGRETRTDETVRLSTYRQHSPVALIFGSYT